MECNPIDLSYNLFVPLHSDFVTFICFSPILHCITQFVLNISLLGPCRVNIRNVSLVVVSI